MKKHNIIIVAILITLGCCGLAFYHFRYLSFSKFNITPQKIVEDYLEQTYYGEFTLLDTYFYKENGYYIWKYKFVDGNGVEFYEYYTHAYERDAWNPGPYYCFKIRDIKNVDDFYWQISIQEEYGKELILEKYQADDSPHLGRMRYSFNLEENNIDEIADIISTIYDYVYARIRKEWIEDLEKNFNWEESDNVKKEVLEELIEDLCTIQHNNDTCVVTIKDINGKQIFCEEYPKEPIVFLVDNETFQVIVGKGDWRISTFINIKEGIVSEGFDNVSDCDGEKIVYAIWENETMKIIVRDIYDKDKYYKEIIRDFSPVAVPSNIIHEVTLYKRTMHLKYFYGEEFELKEEIIRLYEE